MGYTTYTFRDGHDKVVDAREARIITTERIVHAPALSKIDITIGAFIIWKTNHKVYQAHS